MGCEIEHIEYYLPNSELDSRQLSDIFPDFDLEKIEKKIGIKSRHVVSKEETSLSLAFEASLKVLVNDKAKDIDFIIMCSQTPDYILPTGACVLQDKLGVSNNAGAFDFNLGCSGYIYGLAICKGLIEAGIARKILFVTTDTYTKYIHEKDKGNRSIFGDGATASIISYCESEKIGKFKLGTDGSGFDKLIIKNGGSKYPINPNAELKTYGDRNYYTENCIYMNGPEIFNFTIKNIPKLIDDTLALNDIDIENIDYFIFHQANKFMLDYLKKKIGIPDEKFHINLENTGNTVSSTVPIGLHQAISNKKIKKGDTVLLTGFGVGFSWGATIVKI